MFGRWVIVYIEGKPVRVFVLCNPNTSEEELKAAARDALKGNVEQPSIAVEYV